MAPTPRTKCDRDITTCWTLYPSWDTSTSWTVECEVSNTFINTLGCRKGDSYRSIPETATSYAHDVSRGRKNCKHNRYISVVKNNWCQVGMGGGSVALGKLWLLQCVPSFWPANPTTGLTAAKFSGKEACKKTKKKAITTMKKKLVSSCIAVSCTPGNFSQENMSGEQILLRSMSHPQENLSPTMLTQDSWRFFAYQMCMGRRASKILWTRHQTSPGA